MDIHRRLLCVNLGMLLIIILSFSDASTAASCSADKLFECESFEVCNEETQVCECSKGFRRKGKNCISVTTQKPSTSTPWISEKPHIISSDLGVGIVVVPCIILTLIAFVVYLDRRYMWLAKLRQSSIRRYDSVLVNGEGDHTRIV